MSPISLSRAVIPLQPNIFCKKEELNKINYSLDSRMFSDLILNILDKILTNNGVNNKFNRIIYNYIIEFGNFKTDSPILL